MLKRASAILLIIVANILLLGHTIVPHHHHGEHICICNYSEHSHDNITPGNNALTDLSSFNYDTGNRLSGNQSPEFDNNHTGCSHGDDISGHNSAEDCNGDAQNSCNSCPQSGHSGEGKCNLFDLLVLIPGNETKTERSSISGSPETYGDSGSDFSIGSLPDFFIAYISNQLYPVIPESTLLISGHNDKSPLLCGFNYSKGLRAPPTV